MKIYNDESILSVRQLQKGATEQAVKTKKTTPSLTDNDQVELSDRAREFSRIKDVLETVPDIRSDRIEALSEAVKQGTYTVDSRAVAGKLIRESLIDILA